ncbi:MAG: glucose-6-phosphate isomerase [candidate division Zixibacteria bacterium]|jgi:glucose-6-phosphate isomerase|nr:glucose-6-phosphate isomerase [candidate division Zixibacteria bacterium]
MKHGLFRIHTAGVHAAHGRALARATRDDVVRRLMSRDPSPLASDAKVRALIKNRLGWVDSASMMKRAVPAIERFTDGVFRDGICHVILMGMGGSSLCPEVFSLTFGRHDRVKTFHVLDSTDPAAVKKVLRSIDPRKSLGIVASKSGGTVETRSQEAILLQAFRDAGVANPGRHMAAITDKGSSLESWAKKNAYRAVFINPSDIGGRFSALSYFGLVPGAFTGLDLRALLDYALTMQQVLIERDGETNPALVLGTIMAASAKAGRDKLTFLASRACTPFVPWLEQLIAESTGKKKKGVVPIEGEPVYAASRYGADRLFVTLRLNSERPVISAAQEKALSRSGAPVVEIVLRDRHELGGQFLLWEAATAVAGYHFGINPFDEPNVTESKDNTNQLLAEYVQSGALPFPDPVGSFGKFSVLLCDGKKRTRPSGKSNMRTMVRRFLDGIAAPEYVSILAYMSSSRSSEKALSELRRKITGTYRVATLRGYGPRYLHSIGQLYKGGPLAGRFIILVRARYQRLRIPGAPYDLGTLISAQALGDIQALRARRLPVLVIAVEGDLGGALAELTRSI